MKSSENKNITDGQLACFYYQKNKSHIDQRTGGRCRSDPGFIKSFFE